MFEKNKLLFSTYLSSRAKNVHFMTRAAQFTLYYIETKIREMTMVENERIYFLGHPYGQGGPSPIYIIRALN
jgi:hypothetical protein